MPAWPVNETCSALVAALDEGDDALDDLVRVAAAVSDRVNGWAAGDPCMTFADGPGGIPGDGPGAGPWGYQSCTETLHEFSSRASGVRGAAFNFSYADDAAAPCAALWGVAPTRARSRAARRVRARRRRRRRRLADHLSNGGLDPWHGGGFLTPGDPASGNHWVFMPNGAHHLDLRAPHPDDPPDVTAARQLEGHHPRLDRRGRAAVASEARGRVAAKARPF